MNKYQELKEKASSEMNEFEGIFFAFSEEQFAKGKKKVGLPPEANEREHLAGLGAGGFILKSRIPEFTAMLKRNEAALAALRKQEKEFAEALAFELANHEYCITHDPEPACEALGVSFAEVDSKTWKKALKIHDAGRTE